MLSLRGRSATRLGAYTNTNWFSTGQRHTSVSAVRRAKKRSSSSENEFKCTTSTLIEERLNGFHSVGHDGACVNGVDVVVAVHTCALRRRTYDLRVGLARAYVRRVGKLTHESVALEVLDHELLDAPNGGLRARARAAAFWTALSIAAGWRECHGAVNVDTWV